MGFVWCQKILIRLGSPDFGRCRAGPRPSLWRHFRISKFYLTSSCPCVRISPLSGPGRRVDAPLGQPVQIIRLPGRGERPRRSAPSRRPPRRRACPPRLHLGAEFPERRERSERHLLRPGTAAAAGQRRQGRRRAQPRRVAGADQSQRGRHAAELRDRRRGDRVGRLSRRCRGEVG